MPASVVPCLEDAAEAPQGQYSSPGHACNHRTHQRGVQKSSSGQQLGSHPKAGPEGSPGDIQGITAEPGAVSPPCSPQEEQRPAQRLSQHREHASSFLHPPAHGQHLCFLPRASASLPAWGRRAEPYRHVPIHQPALRRVEEMVSPRFSGKVAPRSYNQIFRHMIVCSKWKQLRKGSENPAPFSALCWLPPCRVSALAPSPRFCSSPCRNAPASGWCTGGERDGARPRNPSRQGPCHGTGGPRSPSCSGTPGRCRPALWSSPRRPGEECREVPDGILINNNTALPLRWDKPCCKSPPFPRLFRGL